MSSVLDRVKALAVGYDDAAIQSIIIDPLVIEAGAMRQVVPYLEAMLNNSVDI